MAAARGEEVKLFAAVSLAPALEEIGEKFAAATADEITLVLGPSSALARQIEHGAPADLVMFADEDWMDYLESRDLILGTSRVKLLGNRLAIVAPQDSPVKGPLRSLADWLKALGEGRLAIADPEHVPLGRYAKAALEATQLWRSLQARTARAGDARAALALVERGEAPLGIVFASDALNNPKLKTIGLIETVPIVYPLAIVKDRDRTSVRRVLGHLKGEEARAIFLRHGFLIRQ
jgi:molybdate transport system substrate-binding protein